MDMSLSKLWELVGDGQGGLECCSPWGCKESDMTEWLNWTEEHNLYICIVCMHVQLCDAMDCSPSGSSVHEIPKGRILGLIVMPSCRDLPDPGIEPMSLKSLALAGWFFTTSSPGKPWDWATELNWRSCLTYGCWHVQNLLYVLTCSRPRREDGSHKSKGSLLENFLLLREASLFVLFRPSADWMRPTHIMEGNLCSYM